MKIFRPGFATIYVDEVPPIEEKAADNDPLPSVEEAMRLALERQTQILEYTRNAKPSPLVTNDPLAPVPTPISSGPNSEAISPAEQLEARATELRRQGPHAINVKPEVEV